MSSRQVPRATAHGSLITAHFDDGDPLAFLVFFKNDEAARLLGGRVIFEEHKKGQWVAVVEVSSRQ